MDKNRITQIEQVKALCALAGAYCFNVYTRNFNSLIVALGDEWFQNAQHSTAHQQLIDDLRLVEGAPISVVPVCRSYMAQII